MDYEGGTYKCERRLFNEVRALQSCQKSVVSIIDEAHLMDMDVLRKLRLMFESFPKNHNLILIGQPPLLGKIALNINQDIKAGYPTQRF